MKEFRKSPSPAGDISGDAPSIVAGKRPPAPSDGAAAGLKSKGADTCG